MKTFKGAVFASIILDVYLKINDVIKETQYPVFEKKVQSKKISNDQELIQSDSTFCPQNQKGNN